MARAFPWLAAVLIFFFARVDFLFTNLTSRIWRDPQIRCRPQGRAVVSQTVMEDTEVLPKSHLHGALQRVLGRDVYKSETPFFYRTNEVQSKFYGLLRIPALPKKNPDGSNYIPARPFQYCTGQGATLEEAEQDAARKALHSIRSSDSEVARWLSWRASTSKQALEIVAAQLADARETDGQSRMKLNRALAIFRGRRIKAHEIRYFMRDDPDACHVVLSVPWERRTYYFEGSGLTSVLAKESAAEAALKILRPMTAPMTVEEKPWQRGRRKSRDDRSKSQKSLRETTLDQKVPGKIRIFQLVEHIMRKHGSRKFNRNDLVYSCRSVMESVEENEEVKVWESNMTEIMLRIPPFELNGKEFNKLNFTKRVPAWRKPPEAEPKYFENDFKRKKFYDLKKESRRCFLEAQQAVAEIAVEQLVEMLPEDFFEKTERSSVREDEQVESAE